jgi:hypothetical protein
MYRKNLIGVTETFLASMEKIRESVLDLNEFLGDLKPATQTERAIVNAMKQEVRQYLSLAATSTSPAPLLKMNPDYSPRKEFEAV